MATSRKDARLSSTLAFEGGRGRKGTELSEAVDAAVVSADDQPSPGDGRRGAERRAGVPFRALFARGQIEDVQAPVVRADVDLTAGDRGGGFDAGLGGEGPPRGAACGIDGVHALVPSPHHGGGARDG